MKNKPEKISGGNYLQKYFTQIPNIIDDSDLTPYEFRVLIHYYRVQDCWEGIRTTAKKCGMSPSKVADVRKSLHDKGFIVIDPGNNGVTIFVTDKSKENLDKYSVPQNGQNRTATRTASVLPDVHKNNPVKNNQEEDIPPIGEDSKKPVFETEAIGQLNLEGEVTVLPKKKVPAEKPQKGDDVPHETLSLHKTIISIWTRLFPTLPLKFPRDGVMVNELIDQCRFQMAQRGIVVNDEAVAEFFEIAMKNLPPFYKGWLMPAINKNFATIIDKIADGNQKPNFKNSADQFSRFAGFA